MSYILNIFIELELDTLKFLTARLFEDVFRSSGLLIGLSPWFHYLKEQRIRLFKVTLETFYLQVFWTVVACLHRSIWQQFIFFPLMCFDIMDGQRVCLRQVLFSPLCIDVSLQVFGAVNCIFVDRNDFSAGFVVQLFLFAVQRWILQMNKLFPLSCHVVSVWNLGPDECPKW